jgi:hypothetical protein
MDAEVLKRLSELKKARTKAQKSLAVNHSVILDATKRVKKSVVG